MEVVKVWIFSVVFTGCVSRNVKNILAFHLQTALLGGGGGAAYKAFTDR